MNRRCSDACRALKLLVPSFAFKTEGAEIRQRAQACCGVNPVDGVPGEEVMPGPADVTKLRYKVFRQLLLDYEIPVLVIRVFAVTIDRFWRKELFFWIEESVKRVG